MLLEPIDHKKYWIPSRLHKGLIPWDLRNRLIKKQEHLWKTPNLLIRDRYETKPVMNIITAEFQDLCNILSSIWPDEFELDQCAMWSTAKPWILHTDASYDQTTLKTRVFTIPLECEPSLSDPNVYTSTITMKQHWNGLAAKFVKGGDNLVENHQTSIIDYSDMCGSTNEPFDPEFHAKHISHLPIESAWGMEPEAVWRWTPGCAIEFDAFRIHCSSNFVESGMSVKRGITLFARIRSN